MYCTGGVRCERASAYLRSKGPAFQDVVQLHGGVTACLCGRASLHGCCVWPRFFLWNARTCRASAAALLLSSYAQELCNDSLSLPKATWAADLHKEMR